MAKLIDKITPQKENFSQWYTDIVKNAKLVEYGPTKGMLILRPYGYAIWENIQKELDPEFKKLGVENVYFPLLIPESLFMKEVEHVEGFAPEVAMVTQVGNKVLEERLFIRPTSEVLMANFFEKEVKSYRDLPLLYNQWVNVMRWEKTTRPFLRTSEFLWQEGHTLHNNSQEAQEFTLKILKVYETFMRDVLRLPVVVGQKTEHEKFAGAQTTYTLETLMPDGQALQVGTSHYFGDNFAKAYNIRFQNQNSAWEYAYGTSWGVSTRMIGALIMTHSDDYGLVLPTKIAPIQIMIIVVKNTPELLDVAQELKTKLSHYRVQIDTTDRSFGYKMSEADLKGIPLRIEVGPRDLATNSATISRRDNHEKTVLDLAKIPGVVKDLFKEYDANLMAKAEAYSTQRTSKALDLVSYQDQLVRNPGYVLVPFCGKVSCEAEVKQKTATNSRCIPLPKKKNSPVKQLCFNCGEPCDLEVYFARAY
ncbi:prolyl-tRNA synthetase [Entomoplasma freundtii]|uniref:Proline--tRNA ligase n=1 Tax=Entomoplasma freundtii TaxID=74700 RepID=A0A2K8NQY3_9MOLU|nr:proline--tRNA ligase [Entomoplasma freundtii]ATZ16197.1 prolyl-tRNA synthetase [Entomoplasma freundtii]TDY56902.1 prolyl-tRNA synthetase [Entomoplasma freundtii]